MPDGGHVLPVLALAKRLNMNVRKDFLLGIELESMPGAFGLI
jgi:hypothetical protein